MATPPLSLELAEETVDRVNAALRAGFRPMGRTGPGNGAVTEAATRGIEDGFVSTVSGFESRLRRAKQLYQLEPDWSLYRQNRYQQPVARLHVVPAPPTDSTPDEPTGEITRHLVIPDEHNDPRHPHRLHVQTWIARYGSEHRHDTVIKLGDSGSFDSVSRHDRNDTYKGRLKPFISDDLKNHEASLAAFERGRGDWLPKKKKVRGNHEQRLWDFENTHPESVGTHTHLYEQQLLQFGWRERPFGEITYVDGIGYTHCPMNGIGRPMGGKTATHRAGSMLTAPLVYGHTHKFQIYNDPKIGEIDRVSVIEAGCALPWGEIEDYAKHSPTGWSYGIVDLTVQGGQIIDYAFVSMLTLRRRYSDDGADVRA